MRRVLASLLVLVFSLPLIAPSFASSPDDASLPACCRRNGAHHCAMGMSGGMVNVPSRYTTVSSRCPFSPLNRGPLMLPHAFASPVLPALMRDSAGPAAVVREAEAGYRVSMDRARHKRGPPRFLAL